MVTAEERLEEIRRFYLSHRDRMGLTMTLRKEKAPESNIPNFIARVIYEACRGTIPTVGARNLAREAVQDFQRRYVQQNVREPVEELFDFRTTMPHSLQTSHGVTNTDDFLAFTATQLEPHRCARFIDALELSPRFRAFQAGVLGPRPETAGFGGIPGAGGPHFEEAPVYHPPEYHAPPQPEAHFRRERVSYRPERPPPETPSMIALPPPRAYSPPIVEAELVQEVMAPPVSPVSPPPPAPTVGYRGTLEEVPLEALRESKVITAEALVNKYRPIFLQDVVGNKAINSRLRAAATSGTFSPAYFFYGAPGSGKTTSAHAMIRDYLKEKERVIGEPLFKRAFGPQDPTGGIVPSLLLEVGPEDVRRYGSVSDMFQQRVRPFITTLSYSGLKKYFIFDDVGKLSPEAQSEMKRPLERYPGVVWIFTSNEDTFNRAIWSRMETMHFLPIAREEMLRRLVEIMAKENMDFPDRNAVAERIVDEMGKENIFGDLRQALIRLGSEWTVFNYERTQGG